MNHIQSLIIEQMRDGQDRIKTFQGVFNFRDCGGYPTLDGKRVKAGMLYRSAELHGLTTEAHRQFEALGIQAILDFRDAWEAEAKPNPAFSGIYYERLSADQTVSKGVAFKINKEVLRDLPENFNAEVFADFYRKLPFQNQSYRRLFELMLEENKSVILQHCKIGKDRTGIGVALILLALGVPKNYIVEDYLLSDHLLMPLKQRLLHNLQHHVDETELEKVNIMMGARPDYIEAALDAIANYPGGLSEYFERELGLTIEKLEKLKGIYLEAA